MWISIVLNLAPKKNRAQKTRLAATNLQKPTFL